MCGIFCLLNNDGTLSDDFINQQFLKGSGRGPEFSKLQNVDHRNTLFGFHHCKLNRLNLFRHLKVDLIRNQDH